MNNKTVLDFKNYPDIDVVEFDKWFVNKFFKLPPLDTDWFKSRYDVDVWFHVDVENNQFSLELKLIDVKNFSYDEHLEEMIKDLKKEDLVE